MYYFFDESGNWQEEEKKRLVIGGAIVENDKNLNEINDRITNYKIERGLREIHANEMSKIDREIFLEVIASLLKEKKLKAFLYIINPDVLLTTQKEPDEIYSNFASDLLSELAFGDLDVNVEYDMKFHYSYPSKIIENIENKVSSDTIRMMKSNFYLTKYSFKKQKKRIKNMILRNKYSIVNLDEILAKLEDIVFVSDYLWEEFRLKTEGNLVIREKFKEKSKTKLKKLLEDFNLNSNNLNIDIEYKGKHNQSAGVQIIDFLTNIVRFHGRNPKFYSPAVVEDIYKFIEIKEKDA